ncbi:hypothetical protein B0H11DRAFT_2238023 [Mycena galericulata]|nr:hypothetical protein B0H11DRAFT_2238023 [Mycena galericulata]
MSRYQPLLEPGSGSDSGHAPSQASHLEERCRDLIRQLWILMSAQGHFMRARDVSVRGAREATRSAELLRRRVEAMTQIASQYEKARAAWRALE